MSAVEILDDDNFLGAENAFNLFVCQKDRWGGAVLTVPWVVLHINVNDSCKHYGPITFSIEVNHQKVCVNSNIYSLKAVSSYYEGVFYRELHGTL